MLHFLQNFVYYLTLEVIGPNAHEMQTGLAEARDMDQVWFDLNCISVCLSVCVLFVSHLCLLVPSSPNFFFKMDFFL